MAPGLSALERELFDEEHDVVSDDGSADRPEPPLERVGGARADFVANLGRRVAELVGLVRLLEAEPGSDRARDDLRRRLHALAAGARLLRFARLAEEVGSTEDRLTEAAERGLVEPAEIADIRGLLDRVSSLAWGEAASGEITPPPGRTTTAPKSGRQRPAATLDPVRVPLGPAASEDPGPGFPLTVLVVGPPAIADALQPAVPEGGVEIEVERAPDNTKAIDLARALAPDVIVIDTERPGAYQLVEALVADPLTELVPIVILGRWSKPEDAAAYLALGVTRSLPKPASPDALRRACVEAVATSVRAAGPAWTPLGDLTLDDLSLRLAEELRRGLCDAALASGRGTRFNLGEGIPVLAALWGAVARVRDLVTIQSGGEVRFTPSGPEGALPLAPWLGDDAEGRAREARGPAAVSLDRKVVVVADDDPAVTWFLAGVLRAAGAVVHEAHDGGRAREIIFRITPDLVISDILMPVLDGVALCRALKRDVVLRDVPVVLLSWKEDLLQRVRELGGGADAYLRKEASASSIVQRVREVLRTRHRVGERLAAGGEVRGRLDGLTTRTLLGLACAHRPDATVSVRDAAFLYEIELRAGRPTRASRTAADGTFERGPRVIAALLGVGSGRFVVAPPPREALLAELGGSLEEQLLVPVAAARGAQRLLSGASLVGIERVDLVEDRMAAYITATPEPARSLLRTIAAGASPRALITSGQAAPRLVEDVLCDAAAHGAITAIAGPDGEELLEAALEEELEILRGARVPRPPVAMPPLDLGPPAALSLTPGPVALIDPEPVVTFEPEEAASDSPIFPEIALPDVPRFSTPSPMAALDESRGAPVRPLLSLGSLTPPPVQPVARRPVTPRAPPPPVILNAEETPSRLAPRPSSFASRAAPEVEIAPPPARKEGKDNRSMWALFAVAGIVFAVGARLSRERQDAPAAPAPAAMAVEAAMPAPAATPEPAPVAPEEPKGEGESKGNPILPVESPLRADDKVPPGQGMLEVVAGTSDTIFIDGTLVGSGPIIKRALAPKKDPYEIRVKLRGEDRVRFVLVKEARLSRVRIFPALVQVS